jgi:hypothetical protein
LNLSNKKTLGGVTYENEKNYFGNGGCFNTGDVISLRQKRSEQQRKLEDD